MERVILIGSPGAGKSTLARQLAERLKLTLHHLDALYWKPGWVETPRPEWIEIQQHLAAQEQWLIDGNYGGTMEIRLGRADAVIFLDLPPWVCLWGALRRRFQYRNRTRPDLHPECPEKFDWDFVQFLWYIWAFPSKNRPGILKRLAALPPGVQVVRLRSRRAVTEFLAKTKGPNQH